jgi:serine acetyltransferase
MTLWDCFTVDLRARSDKKPSFGEVLNRFIFEPGQRTVVYYRIAQFLKKVRFPRRTAIVLSRLIMVRINRIPGLEIRTQNEIGPGLSIFHPHDIVIGFGVKVGK